MLNRLVIIYNLDFLKTKELLIANRTNQSFIPYLYSICFHGCPLR